MVSVVGVPPLFVPALGLWNLIERDVFDVGFGFELGAKYGAERSSPG